MTVGKGDPELRGGAGSGAPGDRGGQRHDPVSGAPYARELRRPAGRTGSAAARLLEDVDEAKQVTSGWTRPGNARRHSSSRSAPNGCAKGSTRSSTGGKQLADGADTPRPAPPSSLGAGLPRLSGGAVALVGGIDRLGGGAEALETGLADGYRPHRRRCRAGCERRSVQVLAGKQRIDRQARPRQPTPRPGSSTPATSSSPPSTARRRERASSAGEAIDLDRGGQAAPMLVISALHLQHARLDRAQRDARRATPTSSAAKPASTPASPAAPPSSTTTAASPATRIPLVVVGDHPRHLPGPGRRSCGRCCWRRSPSASTWSRSASPSASSPCSSTSPTAGRSAATPTSTRSARR